MRLQTLTFEYKLISRILGSNFLHMITDSNFNILEMSEKRLVAHPSIATLLQKTGHLRDHFDMPGSPPEPGHLSVLYNVRPLMAMDAPENFFVTFPIFTLYLVCLPENCYYAALRDAGTLPNLHPHRSTGIIYADEQDRLAGFNDTFHAFFRDRFDKPEKMLGQPLSALLDPSPAGITGARMSESVLPETQDLKKAFAWKAGNRLPSFEYHPAGSVPAEDQEGLRFSNPDPDGQAILFLPVPLSGNRDFSFELEFEILSGSAPVLSLGSDRPDLLLSGAGGYSLGLDVKEQCFSFKRRGVIQAVADAGPRESAMSWRWVRSGAAFTFLENGKRSLFYYDANPLLEKGSRFGVALRVGSAIRIRSIRLLVSDKTSMGPVLPVTRLKIDSPNAFVINPMDNTALAARHPGLRGYILENATELQTRVERLQRENRRIRSASGLEPSDFLGRSAAFLKVRETASKVAPSDLSILLQGETGTGKEALARYIHSRSRRAEGPFVAIDCSALPRDLFESELFGHEKGAFTGASERREGLLEQADGGTLFLDEIGNLPLDAQAKLLRFLQDHTVTRVGGRTALPIDVRVIAATNAPLAELVEKRAFRSDLYYRLETVAITLPPLRARKDDIPELCRHFLALFNTRRGGGPADFAPAIYDRFYAHDWPGNVRELRNAVERTALFAGSGLMTPDLAAGSGMPGKNAKKGRKGVRPLRKLETESIRDLFRRHNGVALRVARELGVSAPALYEKIRKLGLTLETLRQTGKNPPSAVRPVERPDSTSA